MSTKVYTSTSPARLLLVDDHPMLRRGISELLSLEDDVKVVGETSNGQEALAFLENNDVDLVILDHKMPVLTGIETLREIKARNINTKTVLFTVSDSGEDVQEALKLGVDGYLLKDMEPEDLLKALQQAAAGEMVLSEALTPVLAASLRANRATSDRDVSQLTPRERDILKLIAQGLPNKMIARRLDITESTVKVHVKHMLKKMKLKSRVEAAVWVHQERIF